MAAAPPHTRGWTVLEIIECAKSYGSPAHAGMDLMNDRENTNKERLPRTRGDGPKGTRSERARYQAPPHTRGWTVHLLGGRHLVAGSPAHAGMDRLMRWCTC